MKNSKRRLFPLTLMLSAEEKEFLELLRDCGGAGDSLESVMHFIISSVVDGMRRPGSWERPMVTSMFGEDWTSELEPDPDAPFRVYPRGFKPTEDA